MIGLSPRASVRGADALERPHEGQVAGARFVPSSSRKALRMFAGPPFNRPEPLKT